MMQPPRQSEAIRPSFRFQPNCCDAALELLEPLGVGYDFRGVKRVADCVNVRLAGFAADLPSVP